MKELDSLKWLLDQKSEVHEVTVGGRSFYLRSPTVADRDRFDNLVAKMEMGAARLRTPLLQGIVCNVVGDRIAQNFDFDALPAELVEPLIDKARELYGITDSPTDGEID